MVERRLCKAEVAVRFCLGPPKTKSQIPSTKSQTNSKF